MLSTILTKSFSKDTALLILRVITGTVLIHHGFEKLANIENFADAFVKPLHLPFPIFLSYVAAFSEIGGSFEIKTTETRVTDRPHLTHTPHLFHPLFDGLEDGSRGPAYESPT